MMTASPQIHSLYIANLAGEPMFQIEQASIVSGEGIVGDRYAAGLGAFSATKPKIRHISLIALSGIADANRQLRVNQHILFRAGDTRRNIVINHLSADELNSLVGKTFYLGGLAFKGTELCAPCQRPAKLLARPDFIKAFEARGGVRAEALESGILTNGDLLTHQLSIPI
jgi:MOSC domain-containing protein YiiM